jgi:quinol-cytochrome oxidoreductase complex cytochrome b subunit
MPDQDKKYEVDDEVNPVVTPKRIAFIVNRDSVRVSSRDDELVMTFPELILKGLVVFEIVVILLALISLMFDAPLEWIADPNHTPSPAKAPWYFLGIQELLHYFPPVVAGVLIPALVVMALVVIPYFDINLKKEGLWRKNRRRTFIFLTGAVTVFCLLMLIFRAWVIIIPTVSIYLLSLITFFSKSKKGFSEWLRKRSLTEWIMFWFVITVTVLTLVGTFFRGPEWRWVWPWIEGIY